MRTMALLFFSLAWPHPEHSSGQMSQTTRVMFQRAILTAHSDNSAPIIAADRAIEVIDRAKALLAVRENIIASAAVVGDWPITAPSQEAFAAEVLTPVR
jgi:hypothetical protein